jgi:cell division protein FtsN
MSEAYQFAIGRSRALILAACFAAAGLLLFFTGTLTGILYSNSHETTAKVKVPEPVVKAPKVSEVKAPALAGAPSTDAKPAPSGPTALANPPDPTAEATTQVLPSAPASVASIIPQPTTMPAPTTSTNAPAVALGTAAVTAHPATSPSAMATTAKAQSNDKPSATPGAASYALPLAVRVGSFTVRSNAESLVQSLRNMGYQPAMSLYTDSKGRHWYAVKLGPFTRWNTASQVAARISIAENVTPVIGPMQ